MCAVLDGNSPDHASGSRIYWIKVDSKVRTKIIGTMKRARAEIQKFALAAASLLAVAAMLCPVVFPNAVQDCGCKSSTAQVSTCCGSDVLDASSDAVDDCCGCCRSAECKCSDCKCGQASPSPASWPAPINRSLSELVWVGLDVTREIQNDWPNCTSRSFFTLRSNSQYSLSAQQVCVLLSRFTC